jgi:hypothetical protein
MTSIYLVAVSVLVALAVLATLAPSFHDTIPQCIGLALIAVGGATEVAHLIATQGSAPRAHLLLVLGCAVYGAASLLKLWQQRRKP